MELRAATPEDIEEIRDVATASLGASYGHALDSDLIEDAVDRWYEADGLGDDVVDEDVVLPVALDDGTVVGFAQSVLVTGREPAGKIDWVHVHPDYRGQGIGTDLLARVETTLRDRGASRIEARVLVANEAGTRFYEREGYTEAGERNVDIGGTAFRERLYVKQIDDAGEQVLQEAHTTPDGERVYVAFDESDRGDQGPFYVAYSGRDRTDRYGYFCGNCNGLDVAIDTMERVLCNECGNRRKPVRWDAAYL